MFDDQGPHQSPNSRLGRIDAFSWDCIDALASGDPQARLKIAIDERPHHRQRRPRALLQGVIQGPIGNHWRFQRRQ